MTELLREYASVVNTALLVLFGAGGVIGGWFKYKSNKDKTAVQLKTVSNAHEIASIGSAIELANATLKMSKEMQESQKAQIDDLIQNLRNSEEALDTLIDSNRELRKSNEGMKRSNEALMETNERLITANGLLVEEVDKLRADVVTLTTQNKALTAKVEELEKQMYLSGVPVPVHEANLDPAPEPLPLFTHKDVLDVKR